MISYTHSEILKQKNFTGSGFEGALKLLSGVAWRGVAWSGVEWSGVEWSGVE